MSLPLPDNNLSLAPHFIGQKYPAQGFLVETLLDFGGGSIGETAGLAILGGGEHAAVALRKTESANDLVYITGGKVQRIGPASSCLVRLRVRVAPDGACTFLFADGADNFSVVPQAFRASEGAWLGAKVGLFSLAAPVAGESTGYADFDYFRFSSPG
jgi:hypothetical protein